MKVFVYLRKEGKGLVEFTIESVHIEGFKASNTEVNLILAETQTSTVYGKNGCGKTTLLYILSAIFDRNENILRENKVDRVVLKCHSGQNEISLQVNSRINEKGMTVYEFIGFENINVSLLFITTDRGLNNYYRKKVTAEDIFQILSVQGDEYSLSMDSSMKDINSFVNSLNMLKEQSNVDEMYEKKNLIIDNITMATVEKLILGFNKKIDILRLKISIKLNGLITEILTEWIEDMDSSNREEDQANPDDIEYITEQYHKNEKLIDRIIPRVDETNNNVMRTFLDDCLFALNIVKEGKLKFTFPIDRKLSFMTTLIALIEKNRKTLLAVDKIKEKFEKYIIHNKKLVITDERVFIEVGGEQHSLNLLSNGERQFLTFLTVMAILGKDKGVILVDEPGISLDTDWQEVFAQLMEELCPDSQIIYTTHSPDISLKDTNMICNLEVYNNYN